MGILGSHRTNGFVDECGLESVELEVHRQMRTPVSLAERLGRNFVRGCERDHEPFRDSPVDTSANVSCKVSTETDDNFVLTGSV